MKIKKITEILIGSNNKGKVREIKALLPKKVKIFTTRSFNLSSPKETGKTFKLVITGGFSKLFRRSIKTKLTKDKNITIKGLIKISKLITK